MTQQTLVCLDASVALAFALPDEPLHAQAVDLIKALIGRGSLFCTPAMFAYECDSVICLRAWKKELDNEDVQLARAAIAALPITIEYDLSNHDRAFEIARQYDQPRAYDAAYAAHAEARGVELFTVDEPFYQAVNGNKKPKKAPALFWVKLLKAAKKQATQISLSDV